MNGGSNDYPQAIVIDKLGDIYFAGSRFNLISGTTWTDWWIKKYSVAGIENTTQWNYRASSLNSQTDSIQALAVDSQNNLYAAGTGYNQVSGTSAGDWWIKKFSSNGVEDTTNWNKEFSSSGNQEDRAYSVTISASGYIYVAGFGTNLISGVSNNDGWIKKFTTAGGEETSRWNKMFGTTGMDQFNKVTLSGSGAVYISGFGNNLVNGTSQADWWLKKFVE